MIKKADYIWLDEELYPNLQKSSVSVFSPEKKKYHYGVAAFKKNYSFDKKVKKAIISVFGDTRYYLWLNDTFVGTGPCPVGGDFNMPYHFVDRLSIELDSFEVEFYARVQLTPTVETDNSKGHGCFILEALLVLDDERTINVYTDDTWLARKEQEYLAPLCVDYTKHKDEWKPAVLTNCIWNLEDSQIQPLSEKVVDRKKFTIPPNTKKTFDVQLDKIYSAYNYLEIYACGKYKIELITSEHKGVSKRKHLIIGDSSEKYRSNEYYAVGEYQLIVDNSSEHELNLISDIIFVCYPSEEKGYFKCSDEMLNRIYELGKWTVKICRQSIEIDSPVHQENLLCTADYIIESLVNNYTTGDYSLTRFDILRMGRYLKITEGYMYVDNYALLWIEWLYEYYLYSGDKKIFLEVEDGIEAVLKRHRNMENEIGLLSELNGYSFVDWSFIDKHSMFSPPRALGETVANAFYYNMINTVSKIYDVIGNKDRVEYYKMKAERFKSNFNEVFFDVDVGLYFDGLNKTSIGNKWIPENSEKKYHTRYSNILAVLYGLCDKDKAKTILEWVLTPENLEGIQPYFMHYLIEAVYVNGLFEKYGISLIKKWKCLVEECEKGLCEVWHNFDGYTTDYSHGWSATPTYQLPSKLLGLEIVEAGFKKIKIRPKTYGLDWAKIEVPTPYGNIECCLCGNLEPQIHIPKGIHVL